MSAPALPPTPEVAAALRAAGLRPRHIALVSPLREAKGRRLAWRVESDTGDVVKARQFESAAAARAVFALRDGLEPAFVPARACHGCVLLEEWVAGRALTPAEAEAHAEAAGALLGRLHARALPDGSPPTASTERWRRGAESDLDRLAAAGALAAADAARLCAALRRDDPHVEPAARIHLDFCADNMIVDAHGLLAVIDNEQLEIASAGLDLARTFCRWPLPPDAWERFGAGYRAAAPAVPGAGGFWRIVAAAVGARVYLERGAPLLAGALTILRRAAGGPPWSDWCGR